MELLADEVLGDRFRCPLGARAARTIKWVARNERLEAALQAERWISMYQRSGQAKVWVAPIAARPHHKVGVPK